MNAQAANPNFGSILDKAPSEVERPKPLPIGTYVTQLVGLPRMDKSTLKKTEYYEFLHKILSAGDDVDTEALEAYLTAPDGTKKKLNEVTMKNTYYLTENAIWRLDQFFVDCGIELDGQQSRREMAESTAGKQVGIYVTHTPSSDGETVFANVNKTLAIE